jgi:hypothetical protein
MKPFRLPLIINAIALIGSYLIWGLPAAITVLILTVLEVSFSFDNAVVNAKILERMNQKWQKLFLTVGILIAVFGMRLIFPLLIVALATHESPLGALTMAINNPSEYAHHLHLAHPAIAAFGGVFLGMLFLDWLFEEREIKWLKGVEHALAKVGKLDNISTVIMLIGLIVAANVLGHTSTVLVAGAAGMVAYLLVNALDSVFDEDAIATTAKAGIGTFIYLEMIDASFSFDGVIGAFAITSNIFLIAIGLGIGAMYIRSMTVELVKRKTLSEYIYLEHGAHWAIGILAIFMLLSIKFELPEIVTGGTGVVLIGLAFAHSVINNRRENNGAIQSKQSSEQYASE